MITPTTPTDWIVFNNRRIVTPGDNESIPSGSSSDQGLNNNNNNLFSVLEDSDSDDDDDDDNESTSSPTVTALESIATSLIQDTGDHLLGVSERIVVDLREYFLNTPIIDTPDRFIGFTEVFNREFNRINSIDDDSNSNNSIPPLSNQDGTDDTASTSSLSLCDSMGQDTLPSIDDYLPKEYQTAAKSNFNFADAVVFREELGNALAACQHTTRDAGHAYMVDSAKRHCERYGDTTALLPPPAIKVSIPDGNSSGEWRRYDVLKKIYEREVHWNAEALQATVRRFPSAMKEKKNDYGTLPLNYTVRQALNYIESKVSDRVKKQKAYIDLMSSITARAYVPSSDGPVVYLKAMEHDKHCIDILSGSSTSTFEYSWETLIINCQTKIRGSGRHNNTYLRMIEDKWELDVDIDGRWERFKTLYIEELQRLTDDGIGTDQVAMKAQQALAARVDAFESKYESDVQTLNNNQLHLETAFQASGVPSVVETDGTGTISGSIAGTAASGMVSPTALTDLLREMRALKSELNSIKNKSSSRPPPPPPSTGGGGGGNGSGNRGGGSSGATPPGSKVWRQWKHWCHSCGCNLQHDSKDCTNPRRRREGHKDAATYENPMGGNITRNGLWHRWCQPGTNRPFDSPE
jgi:hypothetical protein